MTTAVNIDLAFLARELELPVDQVQRTLQLLEDGNTIPFITRYRKDRTGGLNEEQILHIQQEALKLRMLDERKQTILRSIESQGKLTPELAAKVSGARTLKWLEDVYLPYKPKKQTLATIARQRGMEPLAKEILDANPTTNDLQARGAAFVSAENGLNSVEEVLQGVGHILAEMFSERADVRGRLRKAMRRDGVLTCTRIDPAERAPSPAPPAAPLSEVAVTEHRLAEATPAQIESQPQSEPPGDNETSGSSPAHHQELHSQESHDDDPHSEELHEALAADEQSPVSPTAVSDSPQSVAESTSAAGDETSQVSQHSVPSTEYSVQSSAGNSVGQGTAVAADGAISDGAISDGATSDGATSDGATAVPDGTPAANSALGNSAIANSTTGAAKPKPPIPVAARLAAQKSPTKKQLAKERKKRLLEHAFKDYYNFREALSRLPPHRILAINRGERAKVLRVRFEYQADELIDEAVCHMVPDGHIHVNFLRSCARDALQRLVLPSLERELRRELAEEAEQHALQVFIRNLRKLLLQPPVRGKRVLAVDPGFRNGCKLAAIDAFSNVLEHGMVNLVGNEDQRNHARATLASLIRRNNLELVAIGNGAGCRAAEQLVSDVIASELAGTPIAYLIVNEAGASVYSTSQVGRDELPHCDPMMRSAVSIGRRLQDPLSELVKINPANIGVGMYQHDMKLKHLRESLDAVVNLCVNFVGVELNSASPSLLAYVSGLNQLTARRVYEYRQQHGPFRNREQIKEVPGIGEATFVQAAGFLRISDGDNPFDATWIHPESYETARRLLEKLNIPVSDLSPRGTSEPRPAADSPPTNPATNVESAAPPAVDSAVTTPADPVADPTTDDSLTETPGTENPLTPAAALPATDSPPTSTVAALEPAAAPVASTPAASTSDDGAPVAVTVSLAERLANVPVAEMSQELGIGELLLNDILASLAKPGRDPRDDFSPPPFRTGIMKLEDLKPGMELQGTVLNVVDFGAFVDIGISDSALIHISKLADQFIRDPQEVVSVGDFLKVWVIDVDKERRRVSLTAMDPSVVRRPREQRREGKSRRHKPNQRPATPPPPHSAPQAQKPPVHQRPAQQRPAGKKPPPKPASRSSGPPPKPKPVRPITNAMLTGKQPMRSFSDLVQFYAKKQEDSDEKK